jgi:hypothetical protein
MLVAISAENGETCPYLRIGVGIVPWGLPDLSSFGFVIVVQLGFDSAQQIINNKME